MDLEEFLFYEKQKDRSFTVTKFAEKLGITKSYLNRIRKGMHPPATRLAYQIYKESKGQIDVWKLIKNYYEKESN